MMILVLKAFGPIMYEGTTIGNLQKGGSCQAPSTAAFMSFCQQSFAVTAPSLIGTIACLLHATALIDFLSTRSPRRVHGVSISSNVTKPFPFLCAWHCVVHAPVHHYTLKSTGFYVQPVGIKIPLLFLRGFLQCTTVANVPLGA